MRPQGHVVHCNHSVDGAVDGRPIKPGTNFFDPDIYHRYGQGAFDVFHPLVNTGAGTATNVEVTSFLVSVQLEDSAGDLSAIQNVRISVPGFCCERN